jgi:hypothetical protein
LGKKEITYFIGGTVGVVIGFTFAMIYHIWAIFYETKGLALEGVTSWDGGKPLWKSVNENPGTATFIITTLFLLVGLLFSYISTKNEQQFRNK